MPQAILPLIPILIGAGTTIAGLVDKPSMPKPPAPTAPPTPSGPTTDQARAAITPQALSIESLTGGSVSPEYLATVAPLAAGVGGTPNAAGAMQKVLEQIFGTRASTAGGGSPTTGTPAPFTPSGLPTNLGPLATTPGLSDFMQKIAAQVT